MKYALMFLIMSQSAFANYTYKCNDIQGVNGSPADLQLKVSTSFFTGEVGKISLDGTDFKNLSGQDDQNPFESANANSYELNSAEVKNTTSLKFKTISGSGFLSKLLTFSDGLLTKAPTVYVYYYEQTSIWNGTSNSYYLKCIR